MSYRCAQVRHRGVALMLVLIAVAIAVVLALSFQAAQSTTLPIATNVVNHSHARMITESGMAMVINHLNSDENWRTNYTHGVALPTINLHGGTLKVTLYDGTDSESDGNLADDAWDLVTIVATGVYQGASHTVRCIYRPGGEAYATLIAALDKIEVKGSGVIDSYRSKQGAYGGSNIGSDAVVSTNSTKKHKIKVKNTGQIRGDAFGGVGGNANTIIKVEAGGVITGKRDVLTEPAPLPPVSPPRATLVGPSVGDRVYSSGTTVITSSLNCNKLEIKGTATVRIQGNVTIFVQGDAVIKENSKLEIPAGSQLKLYTSKKLNFEQNAVAGNTADPSRLLIVHLGKKHLEIKNRAEVYATMLNPFGEVKIKDDGQIFGNVAARKIKVEGRGQLHQDLDTGWPLAIPPVKDTGIAVYDTLTMNDDAVVDSYQGSLGMYGGANVGSEATVSTNATTKDKFKVENRSIINGSAYFGPWGKPDVIKVGGGAKITGERTWLPAEIAIPDADFPETIDLPDKKGNITVTGNTTFPDANFDENGVLYCDKLEIKNNAKLTIDGDIIIYSAGEIIIDNTATVTLTDDSTAELWANKKIEIKSAANVNTQAGAHAGNLTIVQTGTDPVTIAGTARVYGRVYHYLGLVVVKDSAQLYGIVKAKQVLIEKSGKIHVDVDLIEKVDQDDIPMNNGQLVWQEAGM
jgi:hypothetical protein